MNQTIKATLTLILIVALAAVFFIIFFPLFLAIAVVGIIYLMILRHRVMKHYQRMQQHQSETQEQNPDEKYGRTIDHNEIK
ncbi:hypothetical protein L3V86_04630 [Thiotrichales bacterium 19S11-10]|nr:hypothetical protein [Thiotrichales bacterium 19S11-10]MCF6807325.1 hypothetical protein [Thiotrichales bacterium 19S9-11]MCF6811294.1 hypothetical protein [Thiotrichales bacterium 19S9-12]